MIEKGKKYLITGGTGIIGYSLCERILKLGGRVVVLSRNEKKLIKLKEKYKIEIVVGDVCDTFTVKKTIQKRCINGIFHLAALAQGMQSGKVINSIRTNLFGSLTVLEQSHNIDFVLGVSSDKAVQPLGNYGLTKLLMERTFKEFEEIDNKTKYRIVRLGNVLNSTDSVTHRWKPLIKNGKEILITDSSSTRFYITAEQSVDLIINCLKNSKDSTPYYENMKSVSLGNLLQAMKNKYLPNNCNLSVKKIGLQCGENLHEKISENGLSSNQAEQYTLQELEEML